MSRKEIGRTGVGITGRWAAAPLRSYRLALPAALLLAVLPAIAGCEAARGPASSGGQDAPKPSRDIDQQVDAVIKDFKNE